MAVADAADELLKKISCLAKTTIQFRERGYTDVGRKGVLPLFAATRETDLVFAESSGIAYAVEKFTAGGVFHHDAKMRQR